MKTGESPLLLNCIPVEKQIAHQVYDRILRIIFPKRKSSNSCVNSAVTATALPVFETSDGEKWAWHFFFFFQKVFPGIFLSINAITLNKLSVILNLNQKNNLLLMTFTVLQ